MITISDDNAFSMMPSHTNPENVDPVFRGLTKREYFAALAMMGIKASTPGCAGENVGLFAVQAADDLIKELNK